jgi:CheY-like chemotaxis protein
MVYGFVKQSGGHVGIYSEPGQGTTVKVYFPRAGAEAGGPADNGAADVGSGGTESILIVEDDAEVLEILRTMLDTLGYRVLAAADGDAALRQIEDGAEVDLLLTDVVLAGNQSGPDIAQRVAAQRPGIKVIFTSGYAEGALRRRAVLLEGGNWLLKPYSIDQLARKLRQVLDG